MYGLRRHYAMRPARDEYPAGAAGDATYFAAVDRWREDGPAAAAEDRVQFYLNLLAAFVGLLLVPVVVWLLR